MRAAPRLVCLVASDGTDLPAPAGPFDDIVVADDWTAGLVTASRTAQDWVLCLQAGEELDPTDASALRTFLANEALGGCVYGMQRFRTFEDGTYDPHPETVYRLFDFRPGLELRRSAPGDAIPADLPLKRRLVTTLRLRYPALKAATGEALPVWAPRPPDLGVLDSLPGAGELTARPTGRHARLVCLLPARNAEADLPGWFGSVKRFADAVVALDDGSTDRTREVLVAEPLVSVLLSNPRRGSLVGWDDSANRNRLLAAAASLEPDWILSLDADERIAADDAAALRRFVDEEADPSCAYAFPAYRMIDDLEHYDRVEVYVVRLFAFVPGQEFSAKRFHFAPVPTSIPQDRWVPTTIRIQHLAALDAARRQDRWAKYRQVDPSNAWEPDYSYTLRPPGRIRAWPPRETESSAVVTDRTTMTADYLDLEGPVLSVVLLAASDDDHRAATSLLQQVCTEVDSSNDDLEVFVLDSSGGRMTAALTDASTQAPLVELDEGPTVPAACNFGLKLAGGDYVLFLRAGDRLEAGALDTIVRAHEAGHAMVAGAGSPLRRTRLARASWLLDEPLPTSYAKEIVSAAGGFLEDRADAAFMVTSQALARWGFTAATVDGLAISHRTPSGRGTQFIRERFELGRSLSRATAVKPPGLPWQAPRWNTLSDLPDRLVAIVRLAAQRRQAAYVGAVPMAVVGHLVSALGLSYEQLVRKAWPR